MDDGGTETSSRTITSAKGRKTTVRRGGKIVGSETERACAPVRWLNGDGLTRSATGTSETVKREGCGAGIKRGRKEAKGDEWGDVSLSSACDDVDVNRQPRGSPFSLPLSVSPRLSSSSELFSPSSSLHPRSMYAIRAFLCLSFAVEKRLPLAHSFQASAAGKASDAASPDATPQSRTAVAACRCTFLVQAFLVRAARALLRGASHAPENMRRDPAKGERINRSLVFRRSPSGRVFPPSFPPFCIFWAFSPIFFPPLFVSSAFSTRFVAITWTARCVAALARITHRARHALRRRWRLGTVMAALWI